MDSKNQKAFLKTKISKYCEATRRVTLPPLLYPHLVSLMALEKLGLMIIFHLIQISSLMWKRNYQRLNPKISTLNLFNFIIRWYLTTGFSLTGWLWTKLDDSKGARVGNGMWVGIVSVPVVIKDPNYKQENIILCKNHFH